MLIACAVLVAPLPSSAEDLPEWMAAGRHGMVASDSPEASEAGLELLRGGGNAIDAAAAVSFALSVTRPQSTGLGGGGFMIYRSAEGDVYCLDYRESAPADATPDMFTLARSRNPRGPPPSLIGALSVGVPGVLAAHEYTHQRWGARPLAATLVPAIRLAREGFRVDRHYVDACEAVKKRFDKYPSLKRTCRYLWGTHLHNGKMPSAGDKLVQPELAGLLEGIAANGLEFFSSGPLADSLDQMMRRTGGVLRARDLAEYRVKRRRHLSVTYRDWELLLMPPPSSGGVCIAETLNILECFDMPALLRSQDSLAMHYLAEAMKHAFADRSRWLADPDFANVPSALLSSEPYAQSLSRLIRPDTTGDPDDYGVRHLPDDSGTSHFCVVDRWGNCVVATESINTLFGSLTAVEEWGLLLNNTMDDFTAEPGAANTFGLVQSAANTVAPHKRALSSMSPTIVLREGKPYLLLGASGGPRIITSVLNVILGVLDGNRSLEEAVQSLRLHHQWQPDLIYFDQSPPDALAGALTGRGHQIADQHRTGVVQAILIRPDGCLLGAGDPRKGGRPAGY